MKRALALVGFACALPLASGVHAHDFWIEPHDFQPRVGVVLRVALWEGDRFAGAPYPYDPDRIHEFVLAGTGGRKPVLGKSGAAVGIVKLDAAGLHRLGYRGKRAHNELAASVFERYLLEAGLSGAIEQRAVRGESDRPGVEVFSRCAKALVCAGGACASEADQPLGFPFELVAIQNPYRLAVGESLRIRVLYDGRPLGGVRVAAASRHGSGSVVFATSNVHGEVALELSEPGTWLITAIQMIRAPDELDADWESFWASLTFELPESR